MIATVRCYYNTGLTVSNCLDSYLSLDTLGFDYKDFTNVAIKQDRGLVDIRLSTNYENIKDADYCRINNICYWVTSVVMLNDNVADVQLQQDYLTTVGVSNFDIVAGWCKRRCVTDDTPFSNTIDEPFTPQNILEVDFGSEIKPSTGSENSLQIVVATVDLLNLDKLADAYEENTFGEHVLVPKLPVLGSNNTTYVMNIDGTEKSADIPATCAYNALNSTVRDAMGQLRSLGIESAIVQSYNLPANYCGGVSASDTKFGSIKGIHEQKASSLQPMYNKGVYKNNKVYSGQFQRFVIGSKITGINKEFRPEDVAENVLSDLYSVTWVLDSNPMYNGYPILRPANYHGSKNSFYIAAVNGAQWLNAPISYNGVSGQDLIIRGWEQQTASTMLSGLLPSFAQNVSSGYNAYNNNAVANNINSTAFWGDLSDIKLKTVTTPVQPVNFSVPNISNMVFGQMGNNMALTNSMTVRPDVQFSVIPTLQNYVGNYFIEYRYRLSASDMSRFDDFLTQFGYAVDEPLTKDCFTGRTNFNYIVADSVNIKSSCPLYLREGVINQIQSGVRIWHVKPSRDKLINNPIS
nr:MAG TPA: Major tail protein [Caudoviricetes sp.]